MSYIVRVNHLSGDRIGRVVANRKGALPAASAGTWNVEDGDFTTLGAEEAVIHTVCVNGISRDVPRGIDVVGRSTLASTGARSFNFDRGDRWVEAIGGGRCSTLAGTSARTWGVEGCYGAVFSAQEAVEQAARVSVETGNRPGGLMPNFRMKCSFFNPDYVPATPVFADPSWSSSSRTLASSVSGRMGFSTVTEFEENSSSDMV